MQPNSPVSARAGPTSPAGARLSPQAPLSARGSSLLLPLGAAAGPRKAKQASPPLLPVASRPHAPPLLPAAALCRRTVLGPAASGSQSAPSGSARRCWSGKMDVPNIVIHENSPGTRRAKHSGQALPTLLTSPSCRWQNKSPASGRSRDSEDKHAPTPASTASWTPHAPFQASKVRFQSPMVSCRSIVPYEDLYGTHPSLFNFDAHGKMVPPSPLGMPSPPESPAECSVEEGAAPRSHTPARTTLVLVHAELDASREEASENVAPQVSFGMRQPRPKPRPLDLPELQV